MGKIVLIITCLSAALFAKAQDDQSLVAKGNELYKKQQFDKAAEEYQKAADLNTKNAKAQYNLGDALYKSKKVEAAENPLQTHQKMLKMGQRSRGHYTMKG